MDYVARRVRVGDPVELDLAPTRYDPLTVAAYHQDHLIGYVAPGWRWVAHSLEQGIRYAVTVTGFEYDTRDELSRIAIGITVLPDEPVEEPGRMAAPVGRPPSPPAPGTAPWAPLIIHAPRPRWPIAIPLALLAAGLAAGAWLLMERGLLPQLGRFAGGP
ncbi:hypothetical protein [Taklimakanibacter lacteus]|uniref:hypothetical protein n=1 Tax=Taklimakanibacter lacteus TaxID=2268456 RepID=UPI000E6617A7